MLYEVITRNFNFVIFTPTFSWVQPVTDMQAGLGKWEFPPIGPVQGDYYNLLLHGFQKGSLALDFPVSAEVEDLAQNYAAQLIQAKKKASYNFV